MCPGSQPVTGLASGTPANEKEAYAHEFVLTLSTILKCDVPLPESCQANNNELDASQWNAFRVSLIFFFRQKCCPSTLCRAHAYQYTTLPQTDDWWKSYVSNYTKEGSQKTLFQELVYDYIGPTDEYHCTIGDTQLNGDGSLDVGSCTYPTCVGVNTTLSSKEGFRQGYMVLADWEGRRLEVP